MNDTMAMIKVSDWTITPGPRYKGLGEYSGEEFRDKLIPLLQNSIKAGEKLIVDLDGTLGYGSSFLDEAFAGLIFEKGFKKEQVLDTLQFVSPRRPWLIEEVLEYIKDAEEKKV